MKLLLDTHTFIWWFDEPERMSPTAYAACANTDNTLILSTVSILEMQIKIQLGKLTLQYPLEDVVVALERLNALVVLPLLPEHVYALKDLPLLHRDPFDRLLVAQAKVCSATLVSADRVLPDYGVPILW